MTRIDFPDNTESLHNIGEFIISYEGYQNAFLNALVNRIARVIVTSKMWENPWAVFKKGYLEYGETVEEIFANVARPYSFDPQQAETTLYKREIPDVRAAFHSMNWQKYYPVTISNDQLRQGFLSYGELYDLVAKIIDTLYTGMQLDEYLTMKYMVAREALNGGIYTVTCTNDPEDSVRLFREYTNNLTFLKTTYNRARVRNSTSVEDQIILVPNMVEAVIGVQVLANAFNLGEVQYLGQRVPIDSFTFDADDKARLAILFENDDSYVPFSTAEETLLESIVALKVDRNWWMVFDNYQQFTENYNGRGLYWQYFFHAWKTFSISPYANAILFTTTASTIQSVTVSPDEVTAYRGSSVTFEATVAGTGFADKGVVWSIANPDDITSTDTRINPNNGRLTVGRNEEAQDIAVRATAVNGVYGTGVALVSDRP